MKEPIPTTNFVPPSVEGDSPASLQELSWLQDVNLLDPEKLKGILCSEGYTPENLIAYLKEGFADLYESSVGVSEGYTLEEHTRMGLDLIERFFSDADFTEVFTISDFRLMYAIHDIGKPVAVQKGNKNLQHKYTLDILRFLLPRLSISKEKVKVFTALIDGDPIGSYLQFTVLLEKVLEQIKKSAQDSGLEEGIFINLLLMYYKIDGLSYTKIAGATSTSPLNKVLGVGIDCKGRESIVFIEKAKERMDLLLERLKNSS